MTFERDMPPLERLVKEMTLQIWEHYNLAKSGFASLTELGYRTLDGEVPAYWVDAFAEAHRIWVDAKEEAAAR